MSFSPFSSTHVHEKLLLFLLLMLLLLLLLLIFLYLDCGVDSSCVCFLLLFDRDSLIALAKSASNLGRAPRRDGKIIQDVSVCASNITLIIINIIIVHACFSVVIVGDGGVPSVLKAVPVGGVVALVRIAAITGRFPRPGKPRRHFPLSFSLRLSRDAGFSREAQRVPPMTMMMAPLSLLSLFFV